MYCLIETQPSPLIYLLPIIVLTCQYQNCTMATEAMWCPHIGSLLSGPLWKMWVPGLQKRKKRLAKIQENLEDCKKEKQKTENPEIYIYIFLILVYSSCSETNICLMHSSSKIFPTQQYR